MEEDIVYLKELLALAKMFLNNNSIVTIQDKEIQVLEHLLNELERLQKENENLKIEERRRTIVQYGTMEIHDVINQTLSKDYIPKQVIIDKMKKYELAIKSYDSSTANYKQSQDVGKFIVLKELLGGN